MQVTEVVLVCNNGNTKYMLLNETSMYISDSSFEIYLSNRPLEMKKFCGREIPKTNAKPAYEIVSTPTTRRLLSS